MAPLTLAPREGARKGSRQAKATDTITANLAILGFAGPGGFAGGATPGQGGPNSSAGTATAGTPGPQGSPGVGLGGGLDRLSAADVFITNTSITGNKASTADDDTSGMDLQ